MKLLLNLLMCVALSSVCAQSACLTYGSPSYELPGDIIETADGGMAICGHSNYINGEFSDYLLIKTDSMGEVQWSKIFFSDHQDLGFDMLQANDGTYFIAGTTFNDSMNYDMSILHVSEAGELMEAAFFGNAYAQLGFTMIQMPDGGFIIGGHSDSLTDVLLLFQPSIIRVNANLEPLWLQRFDQCPQCTGEVYDIKLLETGEFMVAGYVTESFFSSTNDAFVAKFDIDGNLLWYNQTSGVDEFLVAGQCLAPTPDGGCMLMAQMNNGTYEVLVAYINAAGETQWVKQFDTGGADYVGDILRTHDNHYAASFTSDNGSRRSVLMKMNIDGDTLFTKMMSNGTMEFQTNMIERSNHTFALVNNFIPDGESTDEIMLYLTTENGDNCLPAEIEIEITDLPFLYSTETNMFFSHVEKSGSLITYPGLGGNVICADTVSVPVPVTSIPGNREAVIVPNPSSGLFKIHAEHIVSVYLTNVSGQHVEADISLTETDAIVNLAQPSGLYFVYVTYENEVVDRLAVMIK